MEAHCAERNSLETEITGDLGSNIGYTNIRWMAKPDYASVQTFSHTDYLQRAFLSYESLRAKAKNIRQQIHNYPHHIHMALLPCETSSI
jgi:hypothetical protein